MPLELHFHPLASFCHKVLIALYERSVAFEPVIVDLGNEASRTAFAGVWPLLKFPVIRDADRGQTVAESAACIEYLDAFYGSGPPMIPEDPDLAWQARMWDRIFDQYLQVPMQKVVTDAIRPADAHDPHGVAEARADLDATCHFLEERLAPAPWAMGGEFSIADCSAAPALFYTDVVRPLGSDTPKLRDYLDRLMQRPSFVRVLADAEPYFALFPLDPKPAIRHRIAQ